MRADLVDRARQSELLRQSGIKDAEFHSHWDSLRENNARWFLPNDEYTAELDRMLELLNQRDFV